MVHSGTIPRGLYWDVILNLGQVKKITEGEFNFLFKWGKSPLSSIPNVRINVYSNSPMYVTYSHHYIIQNEVDISYCKFLTVKNVFFLSH